MKVIACLLMFMAFAGVCEAADGAKFHPLGYSPDGRYFAFEQYGVQDGSGFTYADVFVLDTVADAWAEGTPINVLKEEESINPRSARVAAAEKAAPVFHTLSITEPADVLAANPFTEVVADRRRITFHNHYNYAMGMFGNPEDQGTFSLVLTEVPVPVPKTCDIEDGIKGFRLALRENKKSLEKIVHEDKVLPDSRGCALGYDIEAIIAPSNVEEVKRLVAVIGVYRRGFEGADRRFIAVPFGWGR